MDFLTLALAKKYTDAKIGEPGRDGSAWYNGEGSPDNELGHDNDYYLNLLNSDVYKKNGTWSIIANIKGAQGEQGEEGQDGATWYSGEGEPAEELGNEGDYYLNTITNDVYKKNEAWSVTTNIQGEDGSVIGNYDGGHPASVYKNLIMDGGEV